jgi:hypothetical protein
LIVALSAQITREFGSGYSVNNLEHFRKFYVTYPNWVTTPIPHALRGESPVAEKSHAMRGKSLTSAAPTTAALTASEILYASGRESWQPGRLHSNLSWTHYRTLLRVDKSEVRAFYEIEAIRNNWSARELERQINSLLFERLAKTKTSANFSCT